MPKRRRNHSSIQPYYAVRVGRDAPNIYRTWAECEEKVKGFRGAKYKKFDTRQEAEEFCDRDKHPEPSVQKEAPADQQFEEIEHTVKYTEEKIIVEFDPRKRRKTNDSVAVDTRLPQNSYLCPNTKLLFQRVWTDGSCLGNAAKHTKDMFGGIGVFYGDKDTRNISEPLVLAEEDISEHDARTGASNNKAELMAVVRLLETAENGLHIDVHTDSQYVIKSCTQWIHGWRKRNWMNAAGKPVQNQKIIQKLDALIQSRKGQTKFTHVKGHAGIYENEQADQLAVAGSNVSKYGNALGNRGGTLSQPVGMTTNSTRSYSTFKNKFRKKKTYGRAGRL